jgi:type II secretory pathway pseudopilin PulG
VKIRFLLAVVGLAISFVLPTFAQQRDTADSQITEQLKALTKKTDEAFNKGEAAALAG